MRVLHPDEGWVVEEIPDYEVVLAVSRDELVVAVTQDELGVLLGALNEAMEAVEEWEFETRLGVTRGEARALQQRLGEVYRGASPSEKRCD